MAPLECIICRALDDVVDGDVMNNADMVGKESLSYSRSDELEGTGTREISPRPMTFGDKELMRKHLIADHSKVVARAYFYPDINDATHIWLMSCVEFRIDTSEAIAVVEPEVDQYLEETSCSSTTEESKTTRPNDILESDLSFDMDINEVLMSLLQPTVLNDLNGLGDREVPLKSNRKRPASTDYSISRKRSQDVISKDPKVGRNGAKTIKSTIDPEDYPPNGLIESKAKNKVTCHVCKIDVCNTARQRHVFMVHVKKDDMYKCPKCEYLNSNSVWEAKKHCSSQHGIGTEPISNEDRYRSIIVGWNKKCFPEWKQKRPLWWHEDDEENDAIPEAEDFQREIIESKPESPASCPSPAAFVTDSTTEVDLDGKDNEQPRVPPEGLVIDDRTCNLCWEESRYPGRHIAQKHLRRPLYECPVCLNFGSYEGCSVMKHIHKVHPEEIDAHPISNLEMYAEEIRDLQNRCFPNRPMKLVKSRESTRPRERHHCRKCGAQVAQSDRQRHVYHKHLQQTRIFECPVCNFASNYDVHRVKWHIKWMHKDDPSLEPISHESQYRKEIDDLNEQCFPGWQHRRRPFWWLDQSEKLQHRKEEDDESLDSGEAQAVNIIESTPSPNPESMEQQNNNCEIYSRTSLKNETLQDDHQLDSGSDTMDFDVPSPSTRLKFQIPKDNSSAANEWTCMVCLKEFKPTSNFLRHVAKDHLDISLFKCPVCDEGGSVDCYEVKAHIAREHRGFVGDPISALESHADYVSQRFSECFPFKKMKAPSSERRREHSGIGEEAKVTCQECFQEMKSEDRQIHVYRHHLKEPRLYECPLCDFAHHACSSDVRAHIKFNHRANSEVLPKANLLQHSTAIAEWNEKCFPGWINRKLPASALEDFNRCRLCEEEVRQTSRHIAEAHLKIQLHVCPVCTYGAPESRLVKRHIRNHHSDETGLEPIANVVARRADFSALHDKCFPGRPKRLSNITISNEGRRTKCKLCSSAVSRKRRLSHTLQHHMPNHDGYGCSDCEFTHKFDESAVQTHIRKMHGGNKKASVQNLLTEFSEELQEVGNSCFPDWIPDRFE